MDGYTVEETAEVLGIPQGRVWELIARGVLAGAAEGRADMRVFLRPAAAERQGGTGSGGSEERSENGGTNASAIEASPFRELLTEFRNLTERYGQALLALGEARGEVAALRSRVEVLEARMDMRLPLRAASTVAWEMPDRYAAQGAAAAPPTPPSQPEPMPLHPPEAQPEPMPGQRAAAPDSAEVEEAAPEAAPEPAEAPAKAAEEVPAEAAEEVPAEAAEEVPEVRVLLQTEVPGAEAAEQPKRRVSGGRAAVAGLAEALARAEDPTLADLPGAREAAEALAALQRETETAAEPEPEPEPPAPPGPPAVEAAPEESAPALEPAPEEPAEELPPPEAQQVAFAPPMAELEADVEPVSAVTEVEVEATPQPISEPQAPSVYSTEVVEPDWFADGDFTWLDASSQAVDGSQADAEQSEREAEAEHLDREQEGPAAEAIQDAFQEPAPPVEAGPEASPDEVSEAEHLDQEQEGPAAEAIQEAFDQPDAAHSTEAAPAWPAQDQPPITGSGSVGFGLFRPDDDRHRGQSTGSDTSGASGSGSEASQEEALLWFGDEFEAAELEVAAPGWRDQERLDAAAPAGVALEEAQAVAPSDEEIDRLADEGWDSAEVEAIRSYLGRSGIAEGEPPAAAIGGEPTTGQAAEQPAEPVEAAKPAAEQPAEPAEPPAEPLPEPGQEPVPSPGLDQDWLRGRRGPAATAYRRLRRLFNS